MKTSTFLSKVLNKFHNGKSYTPYPNRQTWATSNLSSPRCNETIPATKKGRNNLAGMMEYVAKQNGVKTTKAKLAICNSLGHTNFDGFANSETVKFSAVKAVLKAAIKQRRAKGD